MVKFFNDFGIYFDWEKNAVIKDKIIESGLINGIDVYEIDLQVTEVLEKFPYFNTKYFSYIINRKRKLIDQVNIIRNVLIDEYKLPEELFQINFGDINNKEYYNEDIDLKIKNTCEYFFNYYEHMKYI